MAKSPKKARRFSMQLTGGLEHSVLLEVTVVGMDDSCKAFTLDTTDVVDLATLGEQLELVLSPETAHQFKSFSIFNAEHAEPVTPRGDIFDDLPLLSNLGGS